VAASVAEDNFAHQYFESLRSYMLSPLPAALDSLRHEYEEIRAERCGFERFVGRLEEIECERPKWTQVGGIDEPAGTRLETVREAYRETVMSVEHYEEVYDKTLCEDVAAEFGSEIALDMDVTLLTMLVTRVHQTKRLR